MKKTRILCLSAMIIAIIGCNTYQKQLNTYRAFSLAHKDQAAIMCSTLFPVKDSIGKTIIDSTHRANNANYLDIIDSLKNASDVLQLKINLDTGKTNPCAAVAKNYQSTISALTAKIDALKNAYKPCKPDTIYKTQVFYRTDVAALTTEQNKNKALGDSLVILKTQLKQQTDTAHSWRKYALIAFGIIGLSILGSLLKIFGKI